MKNFGFTRICAAVPFNKIADIGYNSEQIIKLIIKASQNSASVIVFPELSLTSYTCGDLFNNSKLLEKTINALLEIAERTRHYNILSVIGLPLVNNNKLFNCAAAVNKGQILGIVNKSYIPGYREFYEPRWFSGIESDYFDAVGINGFKIPFGSDLIFRDNNISELMIGIEICEDLWMPIPPSSFMTMAGATVICNLSASNALVSKSDYRRELIKNQSARCFTAYIYSSAGMGESTTDVVFDADALIAENGEILKESKRFLRDNQLIFADIDIEKLVKERVIQKNIKNSEKKFRYINFESSAKNFKTDRYFNPSPFVPQDKVKLEERCREIFSIQSAGLAKRLESIKNAKAVIGISGGLDSTLALLITVKTFTDLKLPLSDIIAVTMPGFGTTERTYKNAGSLCKYLNITLIEKEIKSMSSLMYDIIKHDKNLHDTVYENIQARARTYLLMTYANQKNGIVIGTGDLSEIALGWSTYNGDHISMYNVNSSIPKTLVRFLIKWISENLFTADLQKILADILDQPISPELLPSDGKNISQNTEEKIGPYELHDFFLYNLIRFGFSPEKILFMAEKAFYLKYDKNTVKKWLKVFLTRFMQNQWKRDCVPGGPKVGSIDLSPRGSWRMPAETEISLFLDNFK